MNILFVSGIYPPDIGGPATYVARLAHEFTMRGHVVHVLTLGDRDEECRLPFLVRKIPRGNRVALRLVRLLWVATKLSKGVHLIYATGSPWDSWFASAFAAKMRGKRLVIKVVGDPIWEWAQRRGLTHSFVEEFNARRGGLLIESLKILRNTLAWTADSIITPSKYLKGIVTGWGISPEKIRVIHNAIELLPLEPAPADRREREVVTVARLVPWKGVRELVELVSGLAPDVKMVVIGDGPLIGVLKQEAQAKKLEQRVEFTGKLPREEVLRRLSMASVFVLNSRYEGFPHALLEAMLSGAAVVATRVGGNAELIEDGVNGFLVPVGDKRKLADKICLLLEDESLRKRIAEQASNDVRVFSWQKMVLGTERFFLDWWRFG